MTMRYTNPRLPLFLRVTSLNNHILRGPREVPGKPLLGKLVMSVNFTRKKRSIEYHQQNSNNVCVI